MQIKIIKDSRINENKNTSYKIKLSNEEKQIKESKIEEQEVKDISFKIGDKVKHIEEGINGEIKFIGSDKLSIVWEDNTRERMAINDAISCLDYVSDIQTLVAPTAPQISKNESLSIAVSEAIDAIGDDYIQDEEEKIDIEKIQLQRKVDQLENKLTSKQSNNIKEKSAKELIEVAIMKNIIDVDDEEIEMQKILVMNDEQFEEYKTSILEYDDSHQVTSRVESKDDNRTEAEKMLDKIKGNGGKGIIGDFSRETPTTKTASVDYSSKRSLTDIKDDKFSFSNQYEVPKFGDEFENILNNSLELNNIDNSYQTKTASHGVKKSPFDNLQGLTKPLQVSSKHAASSFPTNTSLSELMRSLDWTTLSGKK